MLCSDNENIIRDSPAYLMIRQASTDKILQPWQFSLRIANFFWDGPLNTFFQIYRTTAWWYSIFSVKNMKTCRKNLRPQLYRWPHHPFCKIITTEFDTNNLWNKQSKQQGWVFFILYFSYIIMSCLLFFVCTNYN